MSYIGRDTDKISNVEVLDNITFDGSSSYTLQKNSVNFTPSSANTLLVSIDGVVQAGNFTVSGSTIDFGTAVAGTSTCDFILHYGIGLITTVSDGTVTTAKLADSSVSLAKLTATGTKDATTFLRGDNTFAAAGGGKVLQVVSGTLSTENSTTSTSFTDTTLDVSITPSSTSSKILVFYNLSTYMITPNNSVNTTIYRDTTNLGDSTYGMMRGYTSTAAVAGYGHSVQYLDSPSTTSAVEYSVYIKVNGGTVYYPIGDSVAGGSATLNSITAMEISA